MGRWLAPIFAVVVGIVFGAAAMMHLDSARATTPAAPPGNPADLNLKVNRDGSTLKLSWNNRESTDGVLEISDGTHQTKLKLDASEIRSGQATYLPESESVGFRLTLADGRTETRQVAGLPVAELSAAPPPEPATTPKPAVRHTPHKVRPRVGTAARSERTDDSEQASKPSRWNRLVHKVFRR